MLCPSYKNPQESTAESSTAASVNRARKSGLKPRNEENAGAIGEGRHQRPEFDLSDNTDTSIETLKQLLSRSIPIAITTTIAIALANPRPGLGPNTTPTC